MSGGFPGTPFENDLLAQEAAHADWLAQEAERELQRCVLSFVVILRAEIFDGGRGNIQLGLR
jgi:hypothetical protein